MGRKHKHPEHENLERWLVSYADFITLLFATFVALYAMAQADLASLKDISSAIRDGFQKQSIISGINSVIQGQSPPTDNPNPLSSEKGAGDGVIGNFKSMTYEPGEVEAVEETIRELRADIEGEKDAEAKKGSGSTGSEHQGTHAPNLGEAEADSKLSGKLEASIQERGLKVSFDSRFMFEPGTAILKKESLTLLDKVAKRLKKFDGTHIIHVEGHTDNQPISGRFPSNWELSSARAATVVKYLIGQHKYNPGTLVVVGYGDTKPIASNATPFGRAKNRRVDLIIYSRKVGSEVNPRTQLLKEKTLIKYEERDKNNRLIRPSERQKTGPVRVIEMDSEGNTKVIIPTHKVDVVPEIEPDLGNADDIMHQAADMADDTEHPAESHATEEHHDGQHSPEAH